MQKQKILLGVTLLWFFSNTAFPAKLVSIEQNKQQADNALTRLDSHYTFPLQNKININGKEKYRLAEYYKGVRVWDAGVVSHKENIRRGSDNQIIGGKFVIEIEDDLTDVAPTLTSDQAIAIATKNASKSVSRDPDSVHVELLIRYSPAEVAELIYLVDYLDEAKNTRPYHVIDAHTGQILRRWEGMATREATGPGGNIKTGKYYYGKEYGPLIVSKSCYMDNAKVTTYDMRNRSDFGIIHKFTCPENTYKEINGAYSPLNDAHYFGGIVYDLYNEWFQVPPLKEKNGNLMKLKMRVHYRDPRKPNQSLENAYWDGKQMNFGDGGPRMYPLVSVDVTGHEISHGYTNQHSDLVYDCVQSGGINEAFSDMAGQAAQYFLHKNKPDGERNDWLVGSDVIKGPKGQALRYFENPTKDGRSISHASNYYDTMDMHFSSGVFNRAFYLLANKPGWGVKKAFEVFTWANTTHWTPNATFDQAACGVATVAGIAEYNKADVIDAFNTVGVDASCKLSNPNPGRSLQVAVDMCPPSSFKF